MDLCVHFGKPAFIVFISSLYLYFGFSNKHFQFNSILCVFVCLWVCLWVCYHDNSKLRASMLTKLGL